LTPNVTYATVQKPSISLFRRQRWELRQAS
jgi:hypothetical protein